jgi:hypothetical protein
VQRDLALHTALAVHEQNPVAQVDVCAIQREYLADPHAADGHQPDDCLIGRRAQRWPQAAGRRDQRVDLGLRVQVRRHSRPAGRQEIGRRDLAAGVDRLQVAGEPTHEPKPGSPPRGVRAGRLHRPAERQLGADLLRAGALQVLDEVRQQRSVAFELVAQRAADLQVLRKDRVQIGHAAPPGQGNASARSAARSTLA